MSIVLTPPRAKMELLFLSNHDIVLEAGFAENPIVLVSLAAWQ